MALFDEIQKQLAQPKQQAVPSYQALAQRFLAAKGGKAAPTAAGAPAASRLGEQAAAAAAAQPLGAEVQGQLAQQQLGAAAVAQRAELAQRDAALAAQRDEGLASLAQTQKLGAGARSAAQQEAAARLGASREVALDNISSGYQKAVDRLASDRKLQVNDLFLGFRKGNEDLAARKDAAELEQTAFMLSMRDKDYLAELERTAALEGAQDQGKFNLAMARARNAGNEELAKLQANWFQQFQKDRAKFAKELASLNIDRAWDLWKTQARADNEALMISAAVGGAGAVAKYSAGGPAETPETVDVGPGAMYEYSTRPGYKA